MSVLRTLSFVGVLSALALGPAAAGPPAAVPVAMYTGTGAYGDGPGMLEETFRGTPDLRITKLTAADIRAGKLKGFRVLLVPGGTGGAQGKALGADGRAAVRSFVEDGGTFVGICAGCYLASTGYDWSLDLLPARVADRTNWQRGRGMLPIDLTADGREWFGRSDRRVRVLYNNGPVLEPIPDAAGKLVVLAVYRGERVKPGALRGVMLNTPAVVAARFGKGWAVGVSPHPEQTEGLKDLVPSAIRWALAHPAAD